MVPHAKSGFWRGLAPYLLSSILLISAYMHVGAVKVAASSLAVIGIPIHFVASLPSMTLAAMQGRLTTTEQLRRQFEFLREQNLILRPHMIQINSMATFFAKPSRGLTNIVRKTALHLPTFLLP